MRLFKNSPGLNTDSVGETKLPIQQLQSPTFPPVQSPPMAALTTGDFLSRLISPSPPRRTYGIPIPNGFTGDITSYVQPQALAMVIEGNIQTAQMYGQMGEGYGQMGQAFPQVGQACANSNTAIAAQIAQVAPVVAAPCLVTPPDRPFELTEWRFNKIGRNSRL